MPREDMACPAVWEVLRFLFSSAFSVSWRIPEAKTPFTVAEALRNLRDAAAQTGPATSGTTGNAPV